MRAWTVDLPGAISTGPLRLSERPDPEPGPGQVRVAVQACGVCRTDLHVAEGDLEPHRPGVIPGHEVVGLIDAVGPSVTRLSVGDRVGVGWLASTCGRCRFCTAGRENLCLGPTFTGWDVDGGYAELAVAAEDYVYPLPDGLDDEHVAPLLCAGVIGYRALLACELPEGGRLGIYGFGASAHLTAQVAVSGGARVHVLTRSEQARRDALELGAASAGSAADRPPEPLDAAILFAPVGALVPVALEALDRGGTLAVAGIHLSDIPALDYQRHLFQERRLRSVTANTRADGQAFLKVAAEIPLRVTTTAYPFSAADSALRDLANGRVRGAAVLVL